MRRTITIAIIAMLAAATGPVVEAETKAAEYDIPSGANPEMCGKGLVCGLATRPCAPEWHGWDEGVFSDSGDETVFGPLGFGADDNPDDTVGSGVLTPAATTGCSTLDPLNGGPDDGFVRMGIFSAALQSDCGDCYTDFQVSLTDTLPSSTFYVFCIITDYQDGRGGRDSTCGEVGACTNGTDPTACDDIEDPRASGCATAQLTSPVPSGGTVNRPAAFVFASFVDQATGAVCLGSKGTLTVLMS